MSAGGGNLAMRRWTQKTGLDVFVFKKDNGVAIANMDPAGNIYPGWLAKDSPFSGEYVRVEATGATLAEAWSAWLAELTRLRLLNGQGQKAPVDEKRRCSICGRASYATRQDAMDVARGFRHRASMSPYLGRACGWWHLTTDEKAFQNVFKREPPLPRPKRKP